MYRRRTFDIDEWKQRILKLFVIDNNFSKTLSKEDIFSNFGVHGNGDTIIALDLLVKENLLLKVDLDNKILYCLNKFDKREEIRAVITGRKNVINLDIDQPLDKEFEGLDYVFQTEANRKIPNRGKYYHCTKKNDSSLFWITLMKPKGNSRAKRLVSGSFEDPNSRLSIIYRAMIKVGKKSNGEIIKKHVEDIEPQACGNSRQYSKAVFDILLYMKKIQEVGNNGKGIIYCLFENEKQIPVKLIRQSTLDEFSNTVITPRINQ